MMFVNEPIVSGIPTTGIWSGRNIVRGIFLGRHNRIENLRATRNEVKENHVQLNPQDWLLLIEGHGRRFGSPVENRYVQAVSDECDLHVEDPIVNPFTQLIADQTLVDRLTAATSILITDYLLSDTCGITSEKDLIRFSSEAVAERFGVRAKSVRRQFSRLSFSNEERLKKEIELALKIRQRLIDGSNKLSREELEEILLRRDEPNVLVMVGGAHEKIFEPGCNIQIEEVRPMVLPILNQSSPCFSFSPSNKLLALKDAYTGMNTPILAGPGDISAFLDKQNYFIEINYVEERLASGKIEWSDVVVLLKQRFDHPKGIDRKYGIILKAVSLLNPIPLSDELFSQSWLMITALKDPAKEAPWFSDWFGSQRAIVQRAAINSAKALRILLNKIGTTLPDEAQIVYNLIRAPLPEVRDEGAEAMRETCKHPWRNNDQTLSCFSGAINIQTTPETKRKMGLAVISANPNFLFVRDRNGHYVIYRGQDPEIEKILIECAREEDPKIRAKAFGAISNYLRENDFTDPGLDIVLTDGLTKRDINSTLATAWRLKHRVVNDQRLIDSLIRDTDNSNPNTRASAFWGISNYFSHKGLTHPELKPLSRKYLNDSEAPVRGNAIEVFGYTTLTEQVLNVTEEDIGTLLQIAVNDQTEDCRVTATFALSSIAKRNIDLFTPEQMDVAETLCAANRNQQMLTAQQIVIINESYERLVEISALEDLDTLLKLEEHPTHDQVQRVIRKKNRYRETIEPLMGKINTLYAANERLQANVTTLSKEVVASRAENAALMQHIQELSDEIERQNARLRSTIAKSLLFSIGGTAARNLVKGRGILHAEFARSLLIDGAWDVTPDFITLLRRNGYLKSLGFDE